MRYLQTFLTAALILCLFAVQGVGVAAPAGGNCLRFDQVEICVDPGLRSAGDSKSEPQGKSCHALLVTSCAAVPPVAGSLAFWQAPGLSPRHAAGPVPWKPPRHVA